MAKPGNKLLIYEPRTEGHHLLWLRYIIEDLLSGGFQLTVALDTNKTNFANVKNQLGPLISKVKIVPVKYPAGRLAGETHIETIAQLFNSENPAHVFLCELDEIASSMCRRAAMGLFPPTELKGHIGGIYFRPRPLIPGSFSFNRAFKKRGLNKLLNDGWFKQILLTDEYLAEEVKRTYPGKPLYFLPDPAPVDYAGSQEAARARLGVPLNKKVFLFYGGPYRRKGLHLAVQAFLHHSLPEAFLLCAGLRTEDREVEAGIEKLVSDGKALSLKKYVSNEEERLCFQSADFVLLPYIKHFGASSVLASAASASKPVIVSNEELLAKLTQDYDLGLTFTSQNSKSLSAAIQSSIKSSNCQLEIWKAGAKKFSEKYSRENYRRVLLNSLT